MPYITGVWNDLVTEIKAEFPEVNAIFRYHQLARRNWGDILKIAEAGGAEQRMPWVIVAFGRETHTEQGSITSVAKLLPIMIIYVCKADAATDIDLYVEDKVRGLHDRLAAGAHTTWQYQTDGNYGNIDFAGTDDTGMTLMLRQEPVFSGALSFDALIGEIAPVND